MSTHMIDERGASYSALLQIAIDRLDELGYGASHDMILSNTEFRKSVINMTVVYGACFVFYALVDLADDPATLSLARCGTKLCNAHVQVSSDACIKELEHRIAARRRTLVGG